jgi:hypothetical protein
VVARAAGAVDLAAHQVRSIDSRCVEIDTYIYIYPTHTERERASEAGAIHIIYRTNAYKNHTERQATPHRAQICGLSQHTSDTYSLSLLRTFTPFYVVLSLTLLPSPLFPLFSGDV